MMQTIRIVGVAVLVACGLTVAAAASAHAASKRQKVDLRFAAVAGTSPVSCGTAIQGLGTTSQPAQLLDLRFYVSDVRLIRKDGRSVRVKLAKNSRYRYSKGNRSVTLIDLENGTGKCAEGTPGMNAAVKGTVPRGRYSGVSWTTGVPFALNHSDTPAAPAPLNDPGLAWSWQSGRKFMKIEVGQPDGATWAAPAFFVHIGSTGCEGNPATGQTVKCSAPNRAKVKLAKFKAKRQKIAVDVRKLVAGNDVTVNQGGAPGCMSGGTDAECSQVFGALGMELTGGDDMDMDMPMAMGSHAAHKQTVFRAIKR